MSNKPREWPNVAVEARDQAAEAAVRGIKALSPIIEGGPLQKQTDYAEKQSPYRRYTGLPDF